MIATAIDAIQLLALTGCRRGEVESLRWEEVDIAGHCLRLSDSKEGKSIRPLGNAAVALLERLSKAKEKKESEAKAKIKGQPNSAMVTPNPYVFPGVAASKPFAGLPKAWLRIKEKAEKGEKGELPADLTPHGLRHAFVSIANDLGYTEPTIAALVGHAAGSATSRYICHLDAVLIAAADRVSGHIFAALEGKAVSARVVPLRRAK